MPPFRGTCGDKIPLIVDLIGLQTLFFGYFPPKLGLFARWYYNPWCKGHYDKKPSILSTSLLKAMVLQKLVPPRKTWKMWKWWFLSYCLSLPYLAGTKARCIVKIPMYCHQINQVVIPAVAAVPNVVSSLEQIVTALGIFYAVIDTANIFFFESGNREN